jgi:hypothetical protein
LVDKLEGYIDKYFNSNYTLDDFNLTRMILITDIDVLERAKVSDYIKVIHRVGRVKGFSPMKNCNINNKTGFCLKGNSNGVEFTFFDLENQIKEQIEEENYKRNYINLITKNTMGIIRAEVRLMEMNTIRAYTDETLTSDQMKAILTKRASIFVSTFIRIIPYGDFYKMDQAVEILRKEVSDERLRRRMLRILVLVPEKKSLLLAQKALCYRRIDKVMDMFAKINLSPVTISKRHDIKHMKNIYDFIQEKKGMDKNEI